MLLTALILAVVAVMIYKGNTNLIHDYHLTKVTDHAAYGVAFGKAMGILSVTFAVSGLLGFLGLPWGSIAVLAIGLVIGIGCIIRVQTQYNGGVF